MVTALAKGIEKWDIKPETIAGGHGSVGFLRRCDSGSAKGIG